MAEVYTRADTHRAYESSFSSVSWGAVFAGAVAAWAITIVMLTLGAALGFSVVSPYPGMGATMSEFHMASGIYTLLTAFVASALGGYLTGRLRTHWVGVHTDEVYFRDTAHGLLSWALATFLGAALIILSLSTIAGGAATGASQGMSSSLQPTSRMMRSETTYASKLFRPSPAATMSAPTTTASTTAIDPRDNDVDHIFTTSIGANKDLSAEDRAYVTQTVAARTGMTQEQASERVNTTYAAARNDAEIARKAATRVSLWLTAALLMGAFSASVFATYGGNLRDRNVPEV